MTKCWCGLILVLALVGCGGGQCACRGAEWKAGGGRGGGNKGTKKELPPKYEWVEVGVLLGKEGESGCKSSNGQPVQPISSNTKVKMGLQCGPVGRTSKVDWEYLGTTEAGDRYRFTRVFPVEGPMTTTTTKEIVYAGKELMVFQDEYQRVVIRPQPEPKKEEKKQKGDLL